MNKFFKALGYLTSVVLLATFLSSVRNCGRTQAPPVTPTREIPTQTYRIPLFEIPLIGARSPIPKQDLPIPASQVDTSIVATIPASVRPVTIGIVIDRDGRLYTTRTTPDNVDIRVTRWLEPPLAFGPSFGATLSYAGSPYVSLATDLVRLYRLHLGCDIGLSTAKGGLLIGPAVRYRVTAYAPLYICASVGYNALRNTLFVGVTLKWR